MARINEDYVLKSYTMKYGEIKFCKPETDTDKKFYITNNNPDDVPLCLTVEEANLLFKLLKPFQKCASYKQKVIDSVPIEIDCDEIDGPYAPQLYNQKILFLYGDVCGFVRALTWIVGRRVKLTIETDYCSYKDWRKLLADGIIEIDLCENLDMIEKFLEECD